MRGDLASYRGYGNRECAHWRVIEVDPDIHNSNPGEFRGPRLRVQAHDPKFPEDEALEAVRRFMATYGEVSMSRSWVEAGLTPSEHTIRRRLGSFKVAVATALNDWK